jgi:hypothetical protein
LIIGQKLDIIIILLLSTAIIFVPSVYAPINEVKEYAEKICNEIYEGDWNGDDCEIESESEKWNFLDDVASLEDSICEDDDYSGVEARLCEEGDVFKESDD